MRPTVKVSFAPHGNANWILKPSVLKSVPIGRPFQTTASPIHGTNNSCTLMRPRVRSPVLKANVTSRDLTASYPLMFYCARFSAASLPIGASVWYHFFDGSWWLGKIKQPSDVRGRYVIRFLDNSGPVLIDLPDPAYNTALPAPCGSWCLKTHSCTNPLQGVLHG